MKKVPPVAAFGGVQAGMEIPADQLRDLRGRCVREVKQAHGAVTLDAAVHYQAREG